MTKNKATFLSKWVQRQLAIACIAASGLTACFAQNTTTTTLGVPSSTRWIIKDDTAQDRATQLVWQRCAAGQKYFENQCVGKSGDFSWQQASALATQGWRIPTREELNTLLRLDDDIFPSVPCCVYWTADAVTHTPEWQWVLNISNGRSITNSRDLSFKTFKLRLVK